MFRETMISNLLNYVRHEDMEPTSVITNVTWYNLAVSPKIFSNWIEFKLKLFL